MPHLLLIWGAPIATRSGFDFLIQRFEQRLNAWKGHLLSPAGRIILIRLVLQALPVYFMATSTIPKEVLKQLTGLIRRFFWGKVDKRNYMAYIAWETVTLPVSLGGLGLRELANVNSILLMKSAWKLALGEQALWVRVVKAKYTPRSNFWQSKRLYNCTAFWRDNGA